MFKKLYRTLVIAFIGFFIVGWSYNSSWSGSWLGHWLGARNSSLYSQLPASLTFFKDYQNTNNLIGDYSLGSPTATFTRATSATTPATYVDANGVIQKVTTSDVPRFAGGYYDETGFHSARGLYMEAAATNLIKDSDGTLSGSGAWTNWSFADDVTNVPTKTQVSQTLLNITDSTAQRWEQVFGDGTYSKFTTPTTGTGTFAQNDVATYSVFIKGTVTGITSLKLYFSEKDSSAVDGTEHSGADIQASLTTEWRKFSYSVQLTDADLSRVSARIFVEHAGSGSIDLQIACPQVEKNPYPTSFIPTATAALTRNAEVLKYEIAGNRTAATETIAIKFMPMGGSFANDGLIRNILDSDADRIVLRKQSTLTTVSFFPNLTDDSGTLLTGGTTNLLNTSYVETAISYGATAGTNYELFLNGSSDGSGTTNYTTPTLGTYFYLGSNNSGLSQLNGLIQSIAIFSRALSAGEVLAVYNTMK
jgi:hypothetical protein